MPIAASNNARPAITAMIAASKRSSANVPDLISAIENVGGIDPQGQCAVARGYGLSQVKIGARVVSPARRLVHDRLVDLIHQRLIALAHLVPLGGEAAPRAQLDEIVRLEDLADRDEAGEDCLVALRFPGLDRHSDRGILEEKSGDLAVAGATPWHLANTAVWPNDRFAPTAVIP